MRPLDGVLVVSLEQAVAAPFATRHLADLGARVVKVERPGSGDFARHYDQAAHGMSSHFVWINRSKESITLNLKAAGGAEILEALLSRADVFVHNLAPGAVERLGFSQERLRTAYPRLIICHISGYGASGPYREKKAYDLLVQAESGLLSVTGTEEEPSKAGIAVADIAAGMYAFGGILAALLAREQEGQGRVIEVSMLEALGEWMGFPAYYALSGRPPPRTGSRHAAIAPYGPFQCGDGRNVLLGVQNEREWEAFCRQVLAEPGLLDDERFANNERRVANRPALRSIIEERFSRLNRGQVVERLDEAGIANAEMRTVSDFLSHPQLKARERWGRVKSPSGPLPFLLPPPVIEGFEPVCDPIPELGQHTRAILAELGYDLAAIERMEAEGIC